MEGDQQPLMEQMDKGIGGKKSIDLPSKSEGEDSRATRLAEQHDGDCCCCIPMSSGVSWIAFFAVLFVLFALSFTIVLFWDTHVHWWYVLTNFIIVVGLGFTAIAFILTYACGRDSKISRNNVAIAQILILFMWAALSIWNIIYANEFLNEK